MKTRIPTLRKDDPTAAPSMEERDTALQLACRAAMRILKDRADMAGSDTPLDAPVPLPESSRHLIRRLAKQRRARLAD
ncbi:MAG: hypothetical protein OXJ53_22035 [Gammaproteobacteria bacterium]|nr:hypothetical protein [Gammaproteobacteria bacterium]MDE0271909.1 hypothetical protein [Gammaproteobacteria bacterium]